MRINWRELYLAGDDPDQWRSGRARIRGPNLGRIFEIKLDFGTVDQIGDRT
jgi:hypothetical protein